jgi:hypothetical protein
MQSVSYLDIGLTRKPGQITNARPVDQAGNLLARCGNAAKNSCQLPINSSLGLLLHIPHIQGSMMRS